MPRINTLMVLPREMADPRQNDDDDDDEDEDVELGRLWNGIQLFARSVQLHT